VKRETAQLNESSPTCEEGFTSKNLRKLLLKFVEPRSLVACYGKKWNV